MHPVSSSDSVEELQELRGASRFPHAPILSLSLNRADAWALLVPPQGSQGHVHSGYGRLRPVCSITVLTIFICETWRVCCPRPGVAAEHHSMCFSVRDRVFISAYGGAIPPSHTWQPLTDVSTLPVDQRGCGWEVRRRAQRPAQG